VEVLPDIFIDCLRRADRVVIVPRGDDQINFPRIDQSGNAFQPRASRAEISNYRIADYRD
jgi:hypothetical protein